MNVFLICNHAYLNSPLHTPTWVLAEDTPIIFISTKLTRLTKHSTHSTQDDHGCANTYVSVRLVGRSDRCSSLRKVLNNSTETEAKHPMACVGFVLGLCWVCVWIVFGFCLLFVIGRLLPRLGLCQVCAGTVSGSC